MMRIIILPVILCFSMFFIQSCNEKSGDLTKVPDFGTLSSQFSQPAAEYTSAPFFVWNEKITKEEVDIFLEEFNAAGSKQVFIHPRPGLVTEYLSDEWFDLYSHTVEKGKQLGMKVWIYDENSYPSGFAGGHVPANMPESFNQGQGLRMVKVDVIPDTASRFFLCLKEDNGTYTDITSVAGQEKGKTGNYYLFYKTYYGKSDWFGGYSYVDLLYQGVTQKFIEITMSGYEKNLGTEFGVTIPGTFTDEPEITSPGGIKWTPDLFNVFEEQWGYDLKTSLPSLYEEKGDWKRIRHNYTSTLLEMFIERWAKPWYEYCESKGLIFTGHYWEHEWPNMRHGGDNMAMYQWHQMPAIDMLFNQYNDSSSRAQFGNIRAVKELASAANQTGRLRKLSETYGGSGWDLTFTEMKRNGDWQYALGVNFMNQHLTYFTMAGARKYDYPPSFDYHAPWWDKYKYINDHYSRLSLALSSGRQINDILVIEPTTTCWMYDSYVKRNPGLTDIGQTFQSFITTLEKAQVEYDLGSERILEDLGSVSGGRLAAGHANYTRVVIPPLTENLNSYTFNLLKKFVRQGGTLIAFSKPSLLDGTESEEVKNFFSTSDNKIVFAEKPDVEFINDQLSSDTRFEKLIGGDLYHHTRTLGDGKLVFLSNASLRERITGELSAVGADVLELNTITGEIGKYPAVIAGEKASVKLDLPPAGSLLLFFSNIKTDGEAVIRSVKAFTEIIPATEVKVAREKENVLMIDFCDVNTGNETMNDLHVFYAADRVFRIHGFKNGNPWNTSVQYKRNIVDRDTFGTGSGFSATYYFTVKGRFDYSGMKAVVERPGQWNVSINGAEISNEEGEWWLDRSFGVYRIGDLVREGRNMITITMSPMKIHGEIEPVYLLGEFSVQPAAKGWEIAPPSAGYTPGAWSSQGMPFYSWDVTYSLDYRIESKEGIYEIVLPEWKGTVAEAEVNGKPAGIIAFPPYRLDVTKFILQGNNRIDLKVTGSLRNLQGPHHNNPPAGISAPGHWRNVRSYPSGDKYHIFDYGLMKEFTLLNGI